MPIQKFDPTTYHPKKEGTETVAGAGGGPSNIPKGLPSSVQQNSPKNGMVKRQRHDPPRRSTPGGGSERFIPDAVQKNDPRPR